MSNSSRMLYLNFPFACFYFALSVWGLSNSHYKAVFSEKVTATLNRNISRGGLILFELHLDSNLGDILNYVNQQKSLANLFNKAFSDIYSFPHNSWENYIQYVHYTRHKDKERVKGILRSKSCLALSNHLIILPWSRVYKTYKTSEKREWFVLFVLIKTYKFNSN